MVWLSNVGLRGLISSDGLVLNSDIRLDLFGFIYCTIGLVWSVHSFIFPPILPFFLSPKHTILPYSLAFIDNA